VFVNSPLQVILGVEAALASRVMPPIINALAIRMTADFAILIDPCANKLGRAPRKKIEPQFSAAFGFLLFTLAFNVRGFMRAFTEAEHPPPM
jgi:hypothetical protein